MKVVPQFRPRYPFGRRCHHGLIGVALAAAGAVLMWDDRHDWPWKPLTRAAERIR